MRPLFTTALACITLISCSTTVFATTPFEASERLIASGHITEARRALEAEIRLRPQHVEARYNLALLLQRMGQKQEAIALYRHNLAIHWHLPSIINLASLLQQQGETAAAETLLQQATTHLRHEATPWYMLATIAEQRGNLSQAEQHLEKALRADPLNGFAHLRLASFQSRHNRADGGIREADRAIALLPGCAPCWKQHGDILLAIGHCSGAIHSYQKSLAIHPEITTRQQLIHALDDAGEHQRAARMQQALDAWLRHQTYSPH